MPPQRCQEGETFDLESLTGHLIDRMRATTGGRYILGVTGCPGAGKSTIAAALADNVNAKTGIDCAIVVPMDGFHLANERLRELGLLELKGIPDSFDSEGFVALLKRLREVTTESVYCPLFDRSIEASIDDGIVIMAKHKLCIVEGNYLLLDRAPWNQCRQYFDEVWYLNVPLEVILPRLYERHERGGNTSDGARAKVESTDLPNAKLIADTMQRADKLIQF